VELTGQDREAAEHNEPSRAWVGDHDDARHKDAAAQHRDADAVGPPQRCVRLDAGADPLPLPFLGAAQFATCPCVVNPDDRT
jgi:hypothetical protein